VKRTVLMVVIGLAVFLATCPLLLGQTDNAALREYPSKYKKRGDVHAIVSSLSYPNVYAEVTQAFTNLQLTINYEEPILGYIEGGRSRGVSGEIVRVWIDPEGKDQYRVEVRNIRLSRMGLIGFATTKDWSRELLTAISKQLEARPSIVQLRSAVETKPELIEARRQLIDAYVAGGLLDDAAEAYRALLAKNPASHLDRIKFADLLVSRGQPDQAIEILKQAEGADIDVTLTLARIYVQTEKSAAAVELLTPLVQNNPTDLKVRYNLARAAYLAGDLPTAQAGFSLVIEQAPQHPFAEQSRLWLKLMETGALQKPLEAKAALAVSELLVKEKFDSLAQRYLESVVDSSSAPERDQVVRMLVEIYQSGRQYAAIVHLLEPQIETLKKEREGKLIYALAMAHSGLREFQPALDYLKQAKKAGYKPPKEFESVLKTYQ
jgi:tetratricopeptide (TPR) repeat protein